MSLQKFAKRVCIESCAMNNDLLIISSNHFFAVLIYDASYIQLIGRALHWYCSSKSSIVFVIVESTCMYIYLTTMISCVFQTFLCRSNIWYFIYSLAHSSGYVIKKFNKGILEQPGKHHLVDTIVLPILELEAAITFDSARDLSREKTGVARWKKYLFHIPAGRLLVLENTCSSHEQCYYLQPTTKFSTNWDNEIKLTYSAYPIKSGWFVLI